MYAEDTQKFPKKGKWAAGVIAIAGVVAVAVVAIFRNQNEGAKTGERQSLLTAELEPAVSNLPIPASPTAHISEQL